MEFDSSLKQKVQMILNYHQIKLTLWKYLLKTFAANILCKPTILLFFLEKAYLIKFPRYVKLDIRLIAFAQDKEYKNHVRNYIVYSHMKVSDIIDIIKERTEIASNKISLFRELVLESFMENNKTLEDYGYIGAEYNKVASSHSKTLLYYDYDVLEKNDPLLNSDFYFHDYKYTSPVKAENSKRSRVWNKPDTFLNNEFIKIYQKELVVCILKLRIY